MKVCPYCGYTFRDRNDKNNKCTMCGGELLEYSDINVSSVGVGASNRPEDVVAGFLAGRASFNFNELEKSLPQFIRLGRKRSEDMLTSLGYKKLGYGFWIRRDSEEPAKFTPPREARADDDEELIRKGILVRCEEKMVKGCLYDRASDFFSRPRTVEEAVAEFGCAVLGHVTKFDGGLTLKDRVIERMRLELITPVPARRLNDRYGIGTARRLRKMSGGNHFTTDERGIVKSDLAEMLRNGASGEKEDAHELFFKQVCLPSFRFLALGGAAEIGGSCHFVKVGGCYAVLDSGVKISGNATIDPLFEVLERLPRPEAVFISHAHADHIGSLQRLLDALPGTSAYMSAETKKLYELSLSDDINKGRISESEKESVLAKCIPTEGGQVGGLKFEFLDAGHIPGSRMVYLEILNWSPMN